MNCTSPAATQGGGVGGLLLSVTPAVASAIPDSTQTITLLIRSSESRDCNTGDMLRSKPAATLHGVSFVDGHHMWGRYTDLMWRKHAQNTPPLRCGHELVTQIGHAGYMGQGCGSRHHCDRRSLDCRASAAQAQPAPPKEQPSTYDRIWTDFTQW